MPNAPLAAHEYDGFDKREDDDVHRKLRQLSFDDGDDDDDDSSDDDDEYRDPYGDPTVITKAIDRLQGYGADEVCNLHDDIFY